MGDEMQGECAEPEPEQADVCCVKISDKLHVRSIKLTLQYLVSQLEKQPELRRSKVTALVGGQDNPNRA
jgi:hypothetical protein